MNLRSVMLIKAVQITEKLVAFSQSLRQCVSRGLSMYQHGFSKGLSMSQVSVRVSVGLRRGLSMSQMSQ